MACVACVRESWAARGNIGFNTREQQKRGSLCPLGRIFSLQAFGDLSRTKDLHGAQQSFSMRERARYGLGLLGLLTARSLPQRKALSLALHFSRLNCVRHTNINLFSVELIVRYIRSHGRLPTKNHCHKNPSTTSDRDEDVTTRDQVYRSRNHTIRHLLYTS